MSHKTYLGNKGYSIYKDSLTLKEQVFIREELTVKPYTPKSPVQLTPYPIYRESNKKFYIPRKFGFDTFGEPAEYRIKDGLPIDLKFEGTLRDNQAIIVEKYQNHIKNGDWGGLLDIYCGFGKTILALAIIASVKVKTIIIVHKGFLLDQWVERIQQFLPNARIGRIQGQIIDIEDKDIVIGMLQSLSMKEYPDDQFDEFGLTVIDECFPFNTPIHTKNGIIFIGTLYKLWKNNEELPEILTYNQITKEFEYKKLTYSWRKERHDLIKIVMSKKIIKCTPEHKILTTDGYKEANRLIIGDIVLSKYDNNHIDNIVCKALNDDQLQIIYGSYLGDGHIQHLTFYKRHRLCITHGDKQREYCFWKASMFGIEKENIKYIKKNGYSQKPSYCFNSKCFDLNNELPKNTKIIPEWLINKIDARGIAIWYMDDGSINNNSGSCYITLHTNNFNINGQQLFLKKFKTYGIDCQIKLSNKNYYLTFNKVNSIKFLDLVSPYIHENMKHKINNVNNTSYLWNNKFLSYGTLIVTKLSNIINNGYGRCSKPYVYDIEVSDNHNFIIGAKKGYCDGPIVSNCHHISAEIFVRSLQKIVTRYTLGLSATMNRKDGLTKVFKMFLGDIIHKEKREQDTIVVVKAIEYKVVDEDFNRMEYDYRGNPKYSTMISKLCTFNPRSEYILYVITNELKLNTKQQFIVLAHNKNLLVYLFKAIEHRKIATVGYYVGGMKQPDLKLSETKQIIIATYSMAAEALDIKTLTTLVLATPKTDVEQAVGRILRVKHSSPLIIDIIDQHDTFKKQWAKRRIFYHKNNYKIKHSDDYKSNSWTDINKKSNKQIEKEICVLDIPMNKCMISPKMLT